MINFKKYFLASNLALFSFPLLAMEPEPLNWQEELYLPQLGHDRDILISPLPPWKNLDFWVRRDQLATAATLELNYTPSPSLSPALSHLRVYLNDSLMRVITLKEEQLGKPQSLSLPLDPQLISDFNRISLEMIGHFPDTICPGPNQDALWVNLGLSTKLKLDKQALLVSNDLAFFPAPFFETQQRNSINLPIILAPNPSLDEIKAATILASYFGSQAGWRGTHFQVRFDHLPHIEENAPPPTSIAFATNKNRPAFMADLEQFPEVDGPVVELINHPETPYAKVLLIMGRDAEDLRQAASTLALEGKLLRGARVKIDPIQQLNPRKPYDAPNWIRTDQPVHFKDLVEYSQQLQTQGLQPAPIGLDLHLPPDLFVWRNQGIPLELIYRYSAPIFSNGSLLNISFNGELLAGYPLSAVSPDDAPLGLDLLTDKSTNQTETLLIPSRKFIDRNRLSFDFDFAALIGTAKPGLCQTTLVTNGHAIIDGDSSIDLSGHYHYISMPDLRAFSRAGFPFSRMADLSETQVLLTAPDSPTQIATLLEVIAGISAQTGYPALNIQITKDWQTAQQKDADLLILGELPDALRNASNPDLELKQSYSSLIQPSIKAGSQWKEKHTQEPNLADTKVAVSSLAPLAAIVGMQSPNYPQRSIVALLASQEADFKLLREAMADTGKRDAMAGSAVLIRSSGVSSQFVGERYFVGQLPWWLLLWFHLSAQPLVLAGLTTLSIVLASLLLWRALRKAAQKRLQSDD